MLSIEHMFLVKHLFQQNIQLTLNLHMLVSGNTVVLLVWFYFVLINNGRLLVVYYLLE